MPPLGFIEPQDRNQDQQDAHDKAMKNTVRFSLPPVALAKGEKIMLTDFWKNADVIADVGFEFNGFHQLTGSCVGAGAGNAIFTLGAVQRTIATNPTKAFVPWWLFSYGRTRFNEGDRGQGEGAVDSVMGDTLHAEGVFDINQAGLPAFKKDDGLYLTNAIEMQWSDGSKIAQNWKDLAKPNLVQSKAPLSSPQDIMTAVSNGYPVLYGCSMYIGNGSVHGSGDTAYVRGVYDGRGGHSTCFLGAWNHPNDGMLYLYSNQWPTQTYPTDPAGAGRCCVWTPESEVQKVFSRYGGDNGETMALSSLSFLPAQPAVLNWIA